MLKQLLITALVGGFALIAGTASAFDAVDGIPVDALSDQEMAQVEAKNHIIRLVELKSGKALPTDAAVEATTRAGSIDGAGQDRPNIVSRLLN